MMDRMFPTEEELDALVPELPMFNPNTVKHRTLAKIEKTVPPKSAAGRKTAFRGLCIAAVICALSASALAVANYATQGTIAAAFGLKTAQPQIKTEETLVPKPQLPEKAAPQETAPEELWPEKEAPAEPGSYEMDTRVAARLQVPEEQQEALKPMGQALNLVTQATGARMTVLQTIGDSRNLYALIRVDFPNTFQLTDGMDFREKYFEFRNTDELSGVQFASGHWEELERTEHSITYLAAAGARNSISGQTAAVTLEEFGRERMLPEKDDYVQVSAGRAIQCTFVPDETGAFHAYISAPETIITTGSAEKQICIGDGSHDLFTEGWETALEEAGGRIGCRWEDGVIAVLIKSEQDALVYLDGATKTVSITYGDAAADPSYEVLLQDSLTQSWVLDYQDATRSWTVELEKEDGSTVEVGKLEVSPLAMNLDLIGSEEAQMPVEKVKGARQTVTLHLADGTEVSPGIFWEWWPEAGIQVRERFAQMIDPADVAGLTGFGLEFTLK